MKPATNINEALDNAFDIDGFDEWLADRGWAWQPLSRGEYGISIEHAQLAFISENPVLWCKAFMKEPDTGNPYAFWDYQEESVLSYDQDVIHQDGAEVGKTREITALLLWAMCTSFGGRIVRPSILVAAPQQTHLDEIIMDMEEHVGEVAESNEPMPFINYFWRKPKRTPHYMARFVTPNPQRPNRPSIGRVYFRPAGHDGEAFRGVHVNGLGLFDEAAKVKNKTIFSEFHRALKPGCHRRFYSVPDGDNSTEFYRMTQQAIPDLPKHKQGLRLFHWAKTLMPPPFWGVDRKQHFITMYGGEDSPGYQRNVLGLHGQQENPVWPWDTLEPNFRDVPEYRCIKLRADKSQDALHVIAYSIDFEMNDGKKVGQNHAHADRYDSLSDYTSKDMQNVRRAFHSLLREFIEPAGAGVFWFGADLGYAKDPTEIFVYQELGPELKLVARIHAKGLGYDYQCELIYVIDELFGFQGAWGVDFGSAGTMVVQMLQNREEYDDGNYEDRMTGFLFGSALDAIDEDGTMLEEEDKKGDVRAVRLPAKELATNLITARLQRIGYAMPLDSDIVQHMSNHTAKEGARNRIFDKKDDHTIDAKRTAMLRKVFNDDGGVDVFSSGTHERAA